MLGGLSLGVSSHYTPQFFVVGIAAGVAAGFCEEIGWTGFAYPRMRGATWPSLRRHRPRGDQQ